MSINNRTALLLIRCPADELVSFSIEKGFLHLSLLYGNTNVNGYELKVQKTPAQCLATAGHTLKCSVHFERWADFKSLKTCLAKLALPRSIVAEVLQGEGCWKGSFSVLLAKHRSHDHFERVFNYLAGNSEVQDSQWIRLKAGHDTPSIPEPWTEPLKLLLNKRINKESVVMVCGGKNSGKSSLLRWAANHLLSKRFDQVFYLDLDAGQPEFTSSAQLSFVRVRRPILSPTYANVVDFHADVLYSCSVASANIEDLSQLYTRNLASLWNELCQDKVGQAPILINTMGFVRVMGFMMLVDAIKLIQPTHLIEIRFEIPANTKKVHDVNFSCELQPEIVEFRTGWLDCLQHVRLQYEYVQLHNEFHLNLKKTFQTRLDCQIAYMSNIKQLLYQPLSSLTPHRLDFDRIAFYVHNEFEVDRKLILDIMNCSWVQLCAVKDLVLSSQKDAHTNPPVWNAALEPNLNVLNELRENVCIGSGLVRNVNLEERCLYVISPESQERMATVNCVVKPGILTTPNELTLAMMEKSATLLPYVGF